MNEDESQTPEANVEPLVEPEEVSPTIESLDESTIEFLVLLEEQSSRVESEQDSEEDELVLKLEEQTTAERSEDSTRDRELEAAQRVADLQRQEQFLRQEIAALQASYKQLSEQLNSTQTAMGRVVQEALVQLEQRKQSLQIAVEQLERRQERIRTEMRTSFAGVSQELAIRVQGFKDYLTGSLQDLAAAAEQLELAPKVKAEQELPPQRKSKPAEAPSSSTPQFAEQQFQSTAKQIRRLLDQYRTRPDYYGPPWQLRRTFEPVHAERVSNWFFTQGDGALCGRWVAASRTFSSVRQRYQCYMPCMAIANVLLF